MFDSEMFASAKIVAVVMKVGDDTKQLYFKFYNHNKKAPTTSVGTLTAEFGYILCTKMMSNDEKIRMVEFECLNGTKKFVGNCLIGRRISKPFHVSLSSKRFYSGFIESFDPKTKFYHVHYLDDNDEEDLYEKELLKYLKP